MVSYVFTLYDQPMNPMKAQAMQTVWKSAPKTGLQVFQVAESRVGPSIQNLYADYYKLITIMKKCSCVFRGVFFL